ncbi:hypothetical protein [uncultured Clostridium sp.]|uniref:hypothetical protein n=1 Tax=uncultured Clostridium sp. TaxID=59620 RepID=UPI0026F3A9FF|nr:hypothetical protein [uncultured Clostridium sp.]
MKEELVKYVKSGKYDFNQLAVLMDGLNKGLDIRTFDNPSITSTQMNLIKEGLILKVDVLDLLSQDYTVEQIVMILEARKKGIKLEDYVNSEFDLIQMKHIIKGIELGLDPTIFAVVNLKALGIHEVVYALRDGLDIGKYIKGKEDNLEFVIMVSRFLRLGVDVSRIEEDDILNKIIREWTATDKRFAEFSNTGLYGIGELCEIKYLLNQGVGIEKFIKPNMNWMGIRELGSLLKLGVDDNEIRKAIKSFDYEFYLYTIHNSTHKDKLKNLVGSDRYNRYQLMELEEGLDREVNVSVYSNPSIDYRVMKIIRRCLEDGIDVEKYVPYMIDNFTAEAIREALILELPLEVYLNKVDSWHTMYINEKVRVLKLAICSALKEKLSELNLDVEALDKLSSIYFVDVDLI